MGIHRSPVNSPHKGQWRGAMMFSLISVWINGGVNNREAGDLRRYRAHYDVTVMEQTRFLMLPLRFVAKKLCKCLKNTLLIYIIFLRNLIICSDLSDCINPNSEVHGAYMGPTWGRQDPGVPHFGPMILDIWVRKYLPLGISRSKESQISLPVAIKIYPDLFLHRPSTYLCTNY